MLNLLAALPICYFVVATDAPAPEEIYRHETWHCWGWDHPASANKGPTHHFTKEMRAPIAPLRFRVKGEYPASRRVVYYDTGVNVAKLCDGNVYGCQWGGKQ